MQQSSLALGVVLLVNVGIAGCSSGSGNGATPSQGGAGGGTTVTGGSIGSGGATSSGGYIGSGGTTALGSGGLAATGGLVGIGGSVGASGGAVLGSGGMVAAGGSTGISEGGSNGGSNTSSGGSGSGGAGRDAAADTVVAKGGAGGNSDASSGGVSDVNPSTLPNITLWLAGDSTVQDNGPGVLPVGWGTNIGQFFSSKVTVVDKAIGGRNVQTFMYTDTTQTAETTTWSSMKASMKAGDYFMVQFGANDSSPGSVRYLAPATFETLLGVMLDAVKATKATPILVTPSCLQIWASGKIDNSRLAPYVSAMIDLGPKKSVLVDDLNARSVEYVNSLGQTAANAQVYYNNDKAHFTVFGATQMAQFVANEVKRIGSPLAAYLK